VDERCDETTIELGIFGRRLDGLGRRHRFHVVASVGDLAEAFSIPPGERRRTIARYPRRQPFWGGKVSDSASSLGQDGDEGEAERSHGWF
jgi:hypothetical protein